MKRRWKISLFVISGLAGAAMMLVLGPYLLVTLAFPDMCGNEPVAEYPSPDRTMKVLVFQRDCGATTGFSTQASLVSAAGKMPTDGGNLFIAGTDHGVSPAGSWGGPTVAVRWEGSHNIVVEHDERARVFKAESRIGDIAIRYSLVR
jgi:hypothetical protein